MIIAPLDTVFTTATAAITTDTFNYRSAKLWELNENDAPENPEVLWALPGDWYTFENKIGIKVTRATVQLFFLKNNYLYEKQPTKTIIVDDMHDAFKLWLAAFEASSIFPVIKSYRVTDIYNDFDANRSGITVFLVFETNQTIC